MKSISENILLFLFCIMFILMLFGFKNRIEFHFVIVLIGCIQVGILIFALFSQKTELKNKDIFTVKKKWNPLNNYAELLLFFSLLILFPSCFGQNSSNSIDNTPAKEDRKVTSIGQSVSAITGRIMVIFQDQQNSYWFGSRENGVYKFDGKNLTHFTQKDGLGSDEITGIQEDQFGNLYFDSRENVCKFDGKEFTTLRKTKTLINEWKLAPNDLWFKGNPSENGVYRYDGTALYYLELSGHKYEDLHQTKYPNVSFSPYGVYTIYKDLKGHIWFGTASFGPCRFDGQSLDWIPEKELMELDDGPAPGVRSIMEDMEGNLWFSNNILNRYKINQKGTIDQKESFFYTILNGIDISKNANLTPYFMAIEQDENGDMWMVTYDEGVWRFDGAGFTHFPIIDGAKNVNLFTIFKDKEGTIWVGSSDDGVYLFNGIGFEKFRI